MSAERDIHAHASHSPDSSTGALAAYLRSSCGHAWLDPEIIGRGYRFHAAIGDEIPAFFNRRYRIGDRTVSVTLQGGLTDTGIEPFEDCRNHAEAVACLQEADPEPSIWIATVTLDGALVQPSEIAAPLFIARRPAEFRSLAEELVAVGVLPAAGCPVCTSQQR